MNNYWKIFLIFVVSFFIFVVYGYISNLVWFINCDFKAPYKAEILRWIWIGIPPVWIIEWYIDIKD